MPDNWAYVFAAYGLAALVLAAYWRHLARRERDFSALTGPLPGRAPANPGARDASTSRASTSASTSMNRKDERRPASPNPGHPRPEPASRPPLR
jgi:hypothetical protein